MDKIVRAETLYYLLLLLLLFAETLLQLLAFTFGVRFRTTTDPSCCTVGYVASVHCLLSLLGSATQPAVNANVWWWFMDRVVIDYFKRLAL